MVRRPPELRAGSRRSRLSSVSAIIDALWRARRGTRGTAALVGADGALSYGELAEQVHALAGRLRSANARAIALLAENGIDWIIADLAGLASGATVVPVPPFFSPAQVSHLLRAAPLDTLLADRAGLPQGSGFVATGEASGSLAWYRRERTLTSAGEGIAKVTFTSGSTGEPKGVCLGREGIERTAIGLAQMLRDLGIRQHLCVLPLATLLENVAGVYTALLLGATVHVPPLAAVGIGGSSSVDGPALRHAIDRTGAHSVILLPQVLKALTRAAAGWNDNPLRFAAVGGGRVADADIDAAHAAGIPAFQGYGLSECHSVVACNRPGAYRRGSVGRPLPGIRIDASDDGELLVRGRSMRGYLGEAPLAGEAPVSTGDLGRVDEDGFVYITGRSKNVFVTSFGRNVSPEWPEALLLHEGAIVQAVVHGEGRPENVAIVVPAHSGIGQAAIAAAVAQANRGLPDYARIGAWIVADEPFTPANGLATASGKPRRGAVLARYLPDDSAFSSPRNLQ